MKGLFKLQLEGKLQQTIFDKTMTRTNILTRDQLCGHMAFLLQVLVTYKEVSPRFKNIYI